MNDVDTMFNILRKKEFETVAMVTNGNKLKIHLILYKVQWSD